MKKKSKKTKIESKVVTGPTLRWLVCEEGDVHIFGPCPRCFSTSGGMLLGSSSGAPRGFATARCTECSESIDYFVDPQERQVYRVEAIREPVGTASA